MQTSDAPSLLHTDHAHLAQTLSAMMVQINALQALLRAESAAPVSLPEARQEDSLPPTGTLLPALRDGLATLEQMTREVLHDIRSLDEAEPLAELIGVTLPEALSRAIEETAESAALPYRAGSALPGTAAHRHTQAATNLHLRAQRRADEH